MSFTMGTSCNEEDPAVRIAEWHQVAQRICRAIGAAAAEAEREAEELHIAHAEEVRLVQHKMEGWSQCPDPENYSPVISLGLASASTAADSEVSSDVGYFSEIDDSAVVQGEHLSKGSLQAPRRLWLKPFLVNGISAFLPGFRLRKCCFKPASMSFTMGTSCNEEDPVVRIADWHQVAQRICRAIDAAAAEEESEAEELQSARAEDLRIDQDKMEGWSRFPDPVNYSPVISMGLAGASTAADSEASSDVGYFSEIDDSAVVQRRTPFQGLLASTAPPPVHAKVSEDEKLFRLCKNLASIFRDAANDPDEW
eukprot:CAMPEP_0172929880 /NCGR_PEP_ID=MMETSP1075-20121228/218706_1 /TAXON_ID=2916 /ORGANISM="Ceratium fusus, Strain PA161109" /LENGTH=309 /DNA_ID=CAMNT_0013791185 /DNA_START=36 /DNA_END=966 /DNA_ORIENTATION=-